MWRNFVYLVCFDLKKKLKYIILLHSEEERSFSVDYFTFSSSIAEHLRSASLVISHAGMLATTLLLHICFH